MHISKNNHCLASESVNKPFGSDGFGNIKFEMSVTLLDMPTIFITIQSDMSL